MKMTDITVELTHSACCIWEDLLVRKEKDNLLDGLWRIIGTANMRLLAVRLANPAEDVWNLLTDDERGDQFAPYDWEFIPAFIGAVIKVDGWPNENIGHSEREAYLAELRRSKTA